MDLIAVLFILFASLVVVWLVSFVVEALRPARTHEASCPNAHGNRREGG
ncbi:hypothetical protein [Desulfomonile tiedjei]|uniref:Uncharacterized protein n=1 Tax=Desulfomonile tiedjei (strain ATCC 49306 / DSM 6799 / DCB-1) TaxID=706587 RepID=I4CEK2_DESTA|nr:hypothetical protein [Desulfomonile tiedjei]AFM27993.1 hypothetical protein Desti_5406 [Desulfomonile tiedjei DSM 6799]